MLDDMLERQCGVISRSQALGTGMTVSAIRVRLRAGRWRLLRPGVYATFSGPAPRMSQLWAAVLWAGEGAVLSHETAAELAGLLSKPSPEVHVTIPHMRTITPARGVVVHRRRDTTGIEIPGRLPAQTRIEETVIDLTQTADSIEDAYGWIAQAVNARKTTVDRLRFALSRRRRVKWRQELLEGLGDVGAGCRSVLELAYLRGVERGHGLPTAERQFEVVRGGGRNYIDVRYSRYTTRVELDGLAAHPQHRRFRDMRRDNHATVSGESTLRYGTADVVGDPCTVARQVALMLSRNGWPGTLRPCRRRSCAAAPSQWVA